MSVSKVPRAAVPLSVLAAVTNIAGTFDINLKGYQGCLVVVVPNSRRLSTGR